MHGLQLARCLRVFNTSYPAQVGDDEPVVKPNTDGQQIPLQGVNDYSGQTLKDERADFDTNGTLEVIRVCPSSHGGLLDNPGLVTKGCGNVLDKWDQVWREKEGDLACTNREDGTPGASYGDIVPCFRPKPPGPPAEGEESGCFDNQAFYDTIEESADKLWLHTNELAGKCLQKGESKGMMAVLGSVALTRNKLWLYNEQMTLNDKPKPFAKTYAKWVEFTDAMAQQVLEYQTNLVATVVLNDPDGQDWACSKPFMDGESASVGIQFWWYHMQGLRMDLSNYLPPKIAQRLLGSVLSDAMSVLAVRYSSAKPSLKRVPQYRADIVAILLCAFELIVSCVDSLYDFFHPVQNHKTSRTIHAKCSILTWNLVLVGCPLKTLHRVCLSSQPKSGSLTPIEKPREETLVQWLHIILPSLFGPIPDKMSNTTSLYVSTKMAATIPGPSWAHVVKACLSYDFLLPTQIMNHFGAFIPGIKGENPSTLMTDGCGNLQCLETCYNSADLSWPAAVGSGLLYIVMHGCPDKSCLKKVMEPILRKLGPSSWECVDSKLAWSSKRPVWFQAIVDLLEPFFVPILEELVEDIDGGRCGIQEGVRKITTQWLEVSACIPPSFFQVCEMLEGMVPDIVHPLCDSVVAHVMISAIYGMITKIIPTLKKNGFPTEKVDLLIAMGENLIQMKSSNDMQKLEGLTDASSNAKTDPPHNLDSNSLELTHHVSEMIANELLAEAHGQVALKAVHRFLACNAEWAGNAIGAQLAQETEEGSGQGVEHKIVAWGYSVYRQTDSYDMVNNIGGVKFSQVMGYGIDWEAGLKYTHEAPEVVVQLLLSRRAELTEVMDTDESERNMLEEIKQLCVRGGGVTKQVSAAE